MAQELPIRITVVEPPKGVTFCVQRGKAELLPPSHTAEETLTFDFTVRLGDQQPNGAPNFLGPFTQGPPAERFVYVNAGTLAGQADSEWTCRAKVKLAGITQVMIDATLATPGAVIEARIAGAAKNGGPVAATVPLLGDGWGVHVTKASVYRQAT